MPRSINPIRTFTSLTTEWAARSQQAACRNAMVATTLLAERRLERQDVESYLAAFHAQRSAAQGHAQHSAHRPELAASFA
jgi:hypothetical protein